MPDDMKSKVERLHGKLNKFYQLDESWRKLGKWPEGVTGSVLHPGAADEEIRQAEARFGHKFSPSYKEFLALHSGWEHFWGDFTLIGTGSSATQRAQDEIKENIEHQSSKLGDKLGPDLSPAAITAWESEEPRNLYLANQLVVGTNFSGFHWVFDTRTRGSDGEMKLVYWNISFGAQKPMFDRFQGLLDYALGEVDFRLERLKKKARLAAKAADAPGKAKAGAAAKGRKKS